MHALTSDPAPAGAGVWAEPTSVVLRFTNLLAVVLPLLGLIAAIVLLWGHGFSWVQLGLLAGMYLLTVLGVTVGFHRLFTHRAFETTRPIQLILGILGSMSVQGPLLKWVAVHRRHHQLSDLPGDPHSPHLHGHGRLAMLRGMWHAHTGWLFEPDAPGLSRYVGDLVPDRLLRTVSNVFIRTQAREPIIQRRLAPSAPEPMPDEWAELCTADRDLLAHVLGARIEYVDAPCLHVPGAERALFGGRALLAGNSTQFAGLPLPEHVAERMSPSEEVLLFHQFNYCRMRQQRIQGLCRRRGAPLDKLRLLLAWTHRAINFRNRIVESNMPLILSMLKLSRIFKPDFDELVSEGQLALLRCVDKFDCSRGFKFSTYACRAILKSFVRVGIKASRYRCRFPVEFSPAMGPSVRPERRSDEAESACLQEIGRILAENRAVLSTQEHEVICARFVLGTTPPGSSPKTLEQVGRSIGLTKERVRQIQNKALQKLRAALEDSLIRAW